MKDKMKMSIEELIDAGYTTEMINQIIVEKIAMKTKEEEKKKAAEAAEQSRKAEIEAARRQYKKAHAKYIKAITGTDMSAEDMADFENSVLLPMEQVWEREFAPKKSPAAGRRVMVNGVDVSDVNDVVEAIMRAIEASK